MNPKSKLPKSTTKVPAAKKPGLPKVTVDEQGHAVIREAEPVMDAPVETPAAEAATPEVVTSKSKKAKAQREQKPTPPPAEDGLVVFALRMTLDERTRLHETAGPAKASRFARMILNAAANRDVDRLREIVEATKQTA